MKAWSDWEIIRRQVAIGGRILDKDNQPLAGVHVTITSMPEVFKRSVEACSKAVKAGWDELGQRLDRVASRRDGIYFFLDLPEGKYTLKAIDIKSGKQEDKRVSISWDKKQKIKMAYTDFKLSAE